ncbi:MAG: RluA family pseudouridine synthase [Bacilli bacterium]
MSNKEIIKYELNSSSRLDKWLSEETEFSRSIVQKMIKNETLFVNSKLVKSSYQLQYGDVIEYEYIQDTIDLTPQKVDFEIVYEDSNLIVINKPLGLVVHPGVGNKDMTLVNGLLYYFDSLSSLDEVRPGIVHRIDKNTTGLLLVAKTNAVHVMLQEMIKNREVSREYIALVHGNIKHNSGTINAPIGRDKNNRQLMCVCDQNSKDSVTHFEVLEKSIDFSLIKCKLETGRTHQIRVHMKYINHPIVGDPVYGYRKTIGNTQLLHAFRLSFIHPISKEEMIFVCDLPTHFKDVLEELNFEYKL